MIDAIAAIIAVCEAVKAGCEVEKLRLEAMDPDTRREYVKVQVQPWLDFLKNSQGFLDRLFRLIAA